MNGKRMNWVLVGLLVLAGWAQATSMSGRVTASNADNGISGVGITVIPNNAAGDPIRWTETDADGYYSVDGLEAGSNLVVTSHPDYLEGRFITDLQEDENTFDMQLQPVNDWAVSLGGLVFDALGFLPLPGVELTLQMSGMTVGTTSDESGQFMFTDLIVGEAVLSAELEGYQSQSQELWLEQGMNDVFLALVSVDVEEMASLGGSVFGENTPLAGATVSLYENPMGPQTTTTDVDGSYQFENLFTGPAWIEVSAEGFLPFSQEVFLEQGENVLDVFLEPFDTGYPASLSGQAYHAYHDMPIGDVSVSLFAANGDVVQLVSDDEGSFFFDDLLSGPAGIMLEKDGFHSYLDNLYLEPGENYASFALMPIEEEPEPAWINGMVQDAATGNGISNAFVLIEGVGNVIEAITAEDGSFSAEGLLSGRMNFVQIEHSSYFPHLQPVYLEPGENALSFELQSMNNDGPAVLGGLVFDSSTDQPVVDVMVAIAQPLNVYFSTLTDEDGAFRFDEGLYAGPATLSIESPAHTLYEQNLVLNPGENWVSIDLSDPWNEEEMLVQGVVLDEISRLPVPGAELYFMSQGGEISDSLVCLSDADGAFEMALPNADAPLWMMTCYAQSYEIWTEMIPGGGGEFWLEVLLTPDNANENWAQLSGTVMDEDGMPVRFAELEAISLNDDGNFWNFYAYTDLDGSYTMNVEAGSYLLVCHAYTNNPMDPQEVHIYWPGTPSPDEADVIQVEAGDEVPGLDFLLPLNEGETIQVSVDGLVLDDDGNAIPGALVRFWTEEEELLAARSFTNEDGYFESTVIMDRLPIVPFSLSAESEGYAMEFFADAPSFITATQFLFSSDAVIHNLDFDLMTPDAFGEGLQGTIAVESGLPASAMVVAMSPNGDYVRTVTPDADGGFQFENLENRELVLLYYAPGHLPIYQGGGLDMDEATMVLPGTDIALTAELAQVADAAGPVLLSGQVYTENREALQGALVMAHTPASGDLRFAFTNANGWFQLEGLASDELVELHVSHAGHDVEVLQVQGDSGEQQTLVLEVELTPMDNTSLGEGRKLPDAFRLTGNHPNPFNPTTMVQFEVPRAARLELAVYDLRGALVTQLADKVFQAGTHHVRFDGSGLPSGLYFLRMQGSGVNLSQRMLLMK